MASLIDVFGRLLLDDEGRAFVKSAVKAGEQAGDQAGKSMGQRVGGALKGSLTTGLKVLGTAASGVFALATAGAVQLEEVAANFRAQTGATAEEAQRASRVINRVAGSNRQSLEEVAEAAIAVRRDLGAVGDEADQLTADFAEFARVTKQGPAAAVKAFDDIIDAWSLSLDDSRVIMDKLVVSGQRFGGSIEADQAALAGMAPQLRALNLDIDDGIALLDLFKASGLDAAAIPRALNSAIQKLDGRPLEDFVAELAGIEDPGKRAQRAIEIFGSKAGVGLANAIRPGMTSLDDFKISTEEATGATHAAADALDSTFGARVQKMISEAGAKIRDLGADFGPALTGLASIASLGGALGVDRLVAKILGPLAGKMKEVGKAAGGALIDGIGTATGAAGTVIGNFVASRIEAVIGPGETVLGRITRKSGAAMGKAWTIAFAAAAAIGRALAALLDLLPGGAAVKAAAIRAGGKIGLMLAGATFVGGAWASMLSSTLGSLPGAGAVKGATGKLGGLLGKSLGGLAAAAFAAVMIFEVVETYNRIKQELGAQLSQISTDAQAQLVSGTEEALATQKAALEKGIADLNGVWDLGLFTGEARDKLQTELDATNAEIERRAIAAATGVVSTTEATLTAGAPAVAAGAKNMYVGMTPAGATAAAMAKAQGELISGSVASGIREKRSSVTSAMAQLIEDLKNAMSPAKEQAQLVGYLTGKELIKGLHSNDPMVKAQAETTRAIIEARLAEVIAAGGKAGKKAQAELAAGLKSKDPAVRAAAQRTQALVEHELDRIAALKAGKQADVHLAQGLDNKASVVGAAARRLGALITKTLLARISVATTGGGGGAAAQGAIAGMAGGGHAEAGSVQWVGERGPELWVPDVAGSVIPNAGESAAGTPAGGTYSTTIVLPERRRDEFEVLERASWYQRKGLVNPRPRLEPSGA